MTKTYPVYPFRFMEAGDSFIYDTYTRYGMQYINGAFTAFKAKHGLTWWKSAVQKTEDGKIRFWKVCGEKTSDNNPTKYNVEKNIALPNKKRTRL